MSPTPDSEIEVLFEDEHLIAIHKPCNIAFHSDDEQQGIVQLVRQQQEAEQLFPVHRLDKMTSGLMVFAKTPEVNQALSKKLAEKQIEKYYLAVSTKKPSKKQGMVAGDMVKGRRGSYLLTRDHTNPAVTRFFARSLKTQSKNANQAEAKWLFLLKPETGKTHQLRVALKSLASPILGDERYGGGEADRGYLHAYRMRFDLNGTRYEISDPHFTGQSFRFEQLLDECEFKIPEALNWPKSSFFLA